MRKKNFARASLVKVITPSPDRVQSECPYIAKCGGCQFWHTTYANELDAKSTAVFETLKRISGVTLPEPRVHAAPSTHDWRNRATLHLHQGELGFYAKESHDIVEIDRCLILKESLNRAISPLRETLKNTSHSAELFIETCGEGCVVTTDEKTARRLSLTPPIIGITGSEYGAPKIPVHETLAGLPSNTGLFSAPGGFRQANAPMNKVLVSRVVELLEPHSGGALVELFAGSGNLTWAQHRNWQEIQAFEFDADAVDLGNRIAMKLGLGHVSFEKADLTKPKVEISKEKVVLLDPPRQGAPAVCTRLLRSQPRAILYVSCDPASLARDLKTLDSAYVVSALELLDMFPRSSHMESIALLIHRDA